MLTSLDLLGDQLRELDRRNSDGIYVGLFYDPASPNYAVVIVEIPAKGMLGSKIVPACNAADAFAHPFCYLPPIPEEIAS